jgi:hypothetical protein
MNYQDYLKLMADYEIAPRTEEEWEALRSLTPVRRVNKQQDQEMEQAIGPVEKKLTHEQLFNLAHAAGMAAAERFDPTPMIVQQHAIPLNDRSPVVQQWVVNDGVCGFAWVVVKPGTCSFARWLAKEKGCKKAYHGGMSIWVHQFNQSMERKEQYAHAFAKVLRDHGVNAHPESRMD